ncbi:MAG: hypothetical protein ACI956_002514 [Nonlabens sp.]|jgi:hypothetical protein
MAAKAEQKFQEGSKAKAVENNDAMLSSGGNNVYSNIASNNIYSGIASDNIYSGDLGLLNLAGEGPVFTIYGFQAATRAKIRVLIASGAYSEAISILNYLHTNEPVGDNQSYSDFIYNTHYNLDTDVEGGISQLQYRSAVLTQSSEKIKSTLVYGQVASYDKPGGKIISVEKVFLGGIPANYKEIEAGKKHRNERGPRAMIDWPSHSWEGADAGTVPWDVGKKIVVGTIGVILAPITIAAGGVWIVVGSIGLANGIDDIGTNEGGSLLQQLSDDQGYKDIVGNVKTGASFITMLGGSFQLWTMGKDIPTLMGVANDITGLIETAVPDEPAEDSDNP